MRAVALLALGLTIGGCSKAPSSSATAAGGAPAAVAAVGNACDRHLVAQADVQPLLSGPITSVKPLAGDAQSCVFTTAGFSTVTVMLRPGVGKMTIDSWRKGQMNSAVTTLPGVGDDAVWQPDLKEVIASRGDTLCDIGAMGPESTPATAAKEGVICNKIFGGL